ncbi:MAG: 16S rRNA (adenine(1518)-N(6)/adenine(1519)-N(6))-dimethyltransferase RsmA [Spirochaetes bacterium]|nr:16S rRNA (adenine(1518)-N(6)/adenine(1519)-N(6))-dimethyltransferase RsmA [Spirochaetota bacterium]
MNKNKIQEILTREKIHPNKRLGQHFLINEKIAEKISSQNGIEMGKRILEIGAGLGALTTHLVAKGAVVTVVEIDAGLCRYLDKCFNGNVELYHADFLKIMLPDHFSLCVSNLPYYCASEIIFKLAEQYSMPVVYALVQKEMAQRLQAPCGTKQYGAMTVSLSLYFHTQHLFDVNPSAFYPKPDVVSSLLRFERKDCLPNCDIIQAFHKIVKAAFWGRRKPLVNSLSRSPYLFLKKEQAHAICESAHINPWTRAEELDMESFLKLASAFKRIIP